MRKIISMPLLLLTIAVYSFSQNIGIGTSLPTEKLHVSGNIKTDTIKPNAIKLTTNAGAGKMLTSDAAGNASWQEKNAGGGVGFGSWGDCSMNGISEYNPVADALGASNDNFGSSVSISGNFAIVGAYLDDVGANVDQGSASIFQHNGSNWELKQKLIDISGGAGDYFGTSVFISGNYAIVGAYSDNGIVVDQGSASIYQFNGSNWVFMQKLTDATASVDDRFGISVSLSGHYAIVGASTDDVGVNLSQGSASIFQYNGSSWVLMQKLTDATGAANDLFGYCVSISGDFAIVGAYEDDIGANLNQGSASIYWYNGSSWVLIQKLSDPFGAAGDFFGISVSISDNYVIVGAHGDDVNANINQGSASIYQFMGGTFILIQKLIDATGTGSDYFGLSVSLSGQYALVGASGDDQGNNIAQGSASIYRRVGMGWKKLQYITDPAGNQSDVFGYASAIDGGTQRFIIGAYGYVNNSGSAIFGKVN